MLTVRILEAAAEEATEAAAWYESERPGLGKDFSDAVDVALDLLEENFLPLLPLSGAAGALGAKRIILKRFPYDVISVVRQGEAIVVAVAHHSREPGYWRKRIAPG